VFPVMYGQTYRVKLFQIKDKTMDNVQNCDSYVNISYSQTCRSYAVLSLSDIMTHCISTAYVCLW
jgi:hypothetical protein